MQSLLLALLLMASAGFIAYRKLRAGAWLKHGTVRHIEVVDRLPLTPQHSIHLVKLKGRWLAVAVSPAGCTVLDSGMETDHARAVGAGR